MIFGMKNANETFFAIFAQCGIYLILRPDSKYDNLFLHANGHAKLNLFFTQTNIEIAFSSRGGLKTPPVCRTYTDSSSSFI